jgi:hypothetical protein
VKSPFYRRLFQPLTSFPSSFPFSSVIWSSTLLQCAGKVNVHNCEFCQRVVATGGPFSRPPPDLEPCCVSIMRPRSVQIHVFASSGGLVFFRRFNDYASRTEGRVSLFSRRSSGAKHCVAHKEEFGNADEMQPEPLPLACLASGCSPSGMGHCRHAAIEVGIVSRA